MRLCPEIWSLDRIGYTLFEGRHHFQHRCAIVIEDMEDAVYTWKQVGKQKRPNLFEGKVPRGFSGRKTLEKLVKNIVEEAGSFSENSEQYREALCTLADLYCQGYDIAGVGLYGDDSPDRIGLPTYPFARGRYWVEEKSSGGGASVGERISTWLLSRILCLKEYFSNFSFKSIVKHLC